MKKVLISVAVVLGVATAAYALTPSTNNQAAAPAVEEHVHNHTEEINTHEGHQHDVAGQYCIWQCSRCGKTYGEYSKPSSRATGRCPDTSSGEHIWTASKCN